MEGYVSVDSWDVLTGRTLEVIGFLILQKRKPKL